MPAGMAVKIVLQWLWRTRTLSTVQQWGRNMLYAEREVLDVHALDDLARATYDHTTPMQL